jgi:hypothetical protein
MHKDYSTNIDSIRVLSQVYSIILAFPIEFENTTSITSITGNEEVEKVTQEAKNEHAPSS